MDYCMMIGLLPRWWQWTIAWAPLHQDDDQTMDHGMLPKINDNGSLLPNNGSWTVMVMLTQ
jgi:hypothetical protein